MMLVRIAALLLCFISLHQALAGAWHSIGWSAFESKDHGKAGLFLERALALNPWDIQTRLLAGRNHLEAAYGEGKEKEAERALPPFEEVTRVLPSYGRGWFYRGAALLRKEKGSPFGVTPLAWFQAKDFFDRALQSEPGSPWLRFEIGKAFLENSPTRASEDYDQGLRLIRESLAVHYANPAYPYLAKPSPFLRPSLALLWRTGQGVETLLAVTARNVASYLTLSEFFRERGIAAGYDEVYATYLTLGKDAYERLCGEGESLLKRGKFKKAYPLFRKAFWLRSWSYPRAKAGILIAEYHMGVSHEGPHPLFREESAEAVRSILADEDDPIGDSLLRVLEPVIRKAGDTELQVLYERHLKGLAAVQEAEGPPTPRFRYAATAWWGGPEKESQLDQKGRLTMTLDLPPGKVRIRIFSKRDPLPSEGPAFLTVLLNNKPLGGMAVTHPFWREFMFETGTSGGRRWLQVEWLGGARREGEKAPAAVLGPVSVEALS